MAEQRGLLGADERLTGEVVGVHYADPGRGFGVIELETRGEGPGARCTGPLATLVEGQTVMLAGRWVDDDRRGPTFRALYYEQVAPATAAGVRAFLATERFAGVPARSRERVVTALGAAAGTVIERQPERLVAEAGLRRDEADELHRAWMEGLAMAELVRLVEPVGWPMSVVRAVHARLGPEAPRVARADPFALAELERVGFAHVDALARHLGGRPDDPRRLRAGARAGVVGARRAGGHQHLPREECEVSAARVLGVDRLVAAEAVDAAVAAGLLATDAVDGVEVVSTPEAIGIEQGLAEALAALLDAGVRRIPRAPPDVADPELTGDQRAAVAEAFRSPVSVVTGGPGTGKTRTLQATVEALAAHGLQVALAAPTGRAAKRLEELTGRFAVTVHRLLEARPDGHGGFVCRYSASERLPHDVVVVDEASMCDTWLAHRLVSAIDEGAHLVLAGDVDQLPPVGPGDVLADLIRSGVVAVTRLTELHRQARGSRIVGLANEVLVGEVGELAAADGDVFLAEEPRRERIVQRVVRAVCERAPERFGVAPDQIQVLAPMYRGPAGIDALNAGLEEALNPAVGEPDVAGHQVGDRVLQTRNAPDLDVANGDVGRVVDLDVAAGTVRVAFPRGEVTFPRDRVRDLVPAWAVSVHKAQGGEWPVVVLVLDASHRPMLWRQLVYTGITRAQRALVVVGRAEALRSAARRNRPAERWTGLAWRLRVACGGTGNPAPSPPPAAGREAGDVVG